MTIFGGSEVDLGEFNARACELPKPEFDLCRKSSRRSCFEVYYYAVGGCGCFAIPQSKTLPYDVRKERSYSDS